MKTKVFFISIILTVIISSCSKNIKYTPEHIEQTSGRYLLNQNEVIDVYYDHNNLFLNWKGASKIAPVVLDENTFFVPDMYKKLRFAKEPKTGQRFLGVVSEDDNTLITKEYLKVADTFKTPGMYLKNKEYDKALAGFLEIQKQDPNSVVIDESEFNSLGYELLNKKDYEKAIDVFKMNVAFHPESDNVYDSLGEAYLKKGDSLEAFNNYKKAWELDSGNKRAQAFVEAYRKNQR